MKTLNKVAGFAVLAGALIVPSLAFAQQTTVRLEPGVAIPVGTPQTNHFNVGADGMVKLDLPLTPYLDVVPGVGLLALSNSDSFNKVGTAWLFGGGLRVKRSHDNHGHGLTAVSPWVDGDLQYVRTGDLNRFGWAVGAGAAVPVTESRVAWLGPFVRYQSVFSPSRAGFDTTDAKVMVVGLSLELGGGRHKKVVAPQLPPPVFVPPPVVVMPTLPPPPVEVDQKLTAVVQFALDSAKLDSKATATLDELVVKVHSGVKVSEITVEGHASSDGPLAHNKVLAQHRAEAVVDYLASKGLDRAKMNAHGEGISHPVASNKTKTGRVANRRSEVNLTVTVKVAK